MQNCFSSMMEGRASPARLSAAVMTTSPPGGWLATTATSRTAGCAASPASISPSSMR
jgi:hypothetical protein